MKALFSLIYRDWKVQKWAAIGFVATYLLIMIGRLTAVRLGLIPVIGILVSALFALLPFLYSLKCYITVVRKDLDSNYRIEQRAELFAYFLGWLMAFLGLLTILG